MNLIPYFAWNNRGNATMNVWFPCDKETAIKSLHEIKYDKDKFGDVSVLQVVRNMEIYSGFN